MKSLGESRAEALRAYRTRWEGSIWGSRQQNRTGEKLIQPLFIQSLVLRSSKAVYINEWPNRQTGKERDRAEVATRPRTPGCRGRAQDPQTGPKPPCSRRLDHESPHRLPQLGRFAHRQDRREARLSSADRQEAPPPLQRRRPRWTRRSSGSRTQSEDNRARTLRDHRVGLQRATR